MKKIYIYILILVFFLINIMPVTMVSSIELKNWSVDFNLTSNENISQAPAIASWGNNLHIVYVERKSGPGYIDNNYVWYVKSDNNGITWNARTRLDNDPTYAFGPKIAVWGDIIHVIWCEYGDKCIHYVKSQDNGKTWTNEVIIATECYESDGYEIGVNGSFVHVSFPSSDFKVSYLRSNDNGITWSIPIKLVLFNSFVSSVSMAIENSNVHIAWRDTKRAGLNSLGSQVHDIFYIKSEDNGFTWLNDKNISKTPFNRSSLPDIAVSGENIYIVYPQDDGIYQIYLSYSRDSGTNWINNIKLTNSTKHVYLPTISVNNETAIVVWIDSSDGIGEIYYSSSFDSGATWSESKRLTYHGLCNYPDIIIVDDWVHLVWDRGAAKYEPDIFYKRCEITHKPIKALIDINPNTLSLKSKGRWITVYIEMKEGYDVNCINVSTILLQNSIRVESHPTEIGDNDNDGIPDLMVKFNRNNIQKILIRNQSIMLQISGLFLNGSLFQGQDTVWVI